LDLLPPENVGQIVINNTIGDFNMMVPSRTIKRAVKGLLKNAIDASADGSPITLTCRKDSEFLFFEVKDEGEGMDSETLLKACEPFYTTKAPGKGLGLGLYLAKSVAEKFGGDLRLVSQKRQGTTVVLSLGLKYIQ
jgi:two-component system sensor histidine kinase RegB